MKTETIQETIRAAPPIGVGGLTIFGVACSDWIIVGTLIYTVFLLIDKLPVVIERVKQFIAYIKGRNE